MIVHAVSQAAFSRRDVPERERPDYTLFIDEFEDFCSLTMPSILSKARKRHLALCIANQ